MNIKGAQLKFLKIQSIILYFLQIKRNRTTKFKIK